MRSLLSTAHAVVLTAAATGGAVAHFTLQARDGPAASTGKLVLQIGSGAHGARNRATEKMS